MSVYTPPVRTLAIQCRAVDPGVLSIRLSGELDLSSCEKVESLLAAIPQRGRAVVDIAALEFLDLAGVRVLLSAKRRLGARLQIASPAEQPLRLLRLIGLEDRLGLQSAVPTLEEEAFSWLESRRGESPALARKRG